MKAPRIPNVDGASLRGGPHGDSTSQLVTIVIPCYNEELVLRASYAELERCMRDEDVACTFFFVDDGSSDATWSILLELQRVDLRVRLMRFTRNFGHQAALKAGIDHAEGDAVVVIDADLQDPPEVIREFIASWKNGFDVVYGRRIRRDGESMVRRCLTTAFYYLARAVTTMRLEPEVGDFYLLDRRVAYEVRQVSGQRPFVRGIVQWLGFSRKRIDYHRLPRAAGRSKYTWAKLYGLACDCFVSFSLNPFPTLGAIASFWFAAALVACAATHASYFFGIAVVSALISGQCLALLAVVFIGQFVWVTYQSTNGRPTYVIDHLDPADTRSPNECECGRCANVHSGNLAARMGECT